MKNAIGILRGIALNLSVTLTSVDVLIILTLLIHERGISFHLFVSSSISFIRSYCFWYTDLSFYPESLLNSFIITNSFFFFGGVFRIFYIEVQDHVKKPLSCF